MMGADPESSEPAPSDPRQERGLSAPLGSTHSQGGPWASAERLAADDRFLPVRPRGQGPAHLCLRS